MAAFSERTPFCPFSRRGLSAMVQMEKAVRRGDCEEELELDSSEYGHS